MATADSVKTKIQGLIAKSNTKTGAMDADLTSAVDRLVGGYGQGGVGITPTGTKTITTNGTHDVTNYANAQVNVPVGITPSGTINITTNGTHDVTNYASAVVAIPEKCVSFVLDVTSQLGGTSATTNTIMTGNIFAKEHYTHDGFKAILTALFTVPNTVGATGLIAQGNVDVSSATSTNATSYGVRGYHSAAATFAFGNITAAAKGSSSHHSFRFTSAGDVKIYLPANMYLPVGRYLVILACGCQ